MRCLKCAEDYVVEAVGLWKFRVEWPLAVLAEAGIVGAPTATDNAVALSDLCVVFFFFVCKT